MQDIRIEPPETRIVIAFWAPRGLMAAALDEARRRGGVSVEDVLLAWCEDGRRLAEEPTARGVR